MRNSFAVLRGLRHEMISGGGTVGAVQVAGRLYGGAVKGGGGAPRREVLAIRPFWHLRLQSRSRTIICRPTISFSCLGAR